MLFYILIFGKARQKTKIPMFGSTPAALLLPNKDFV